MNTGRVFDMSHTPQGGWGEAWISVHKALGLLLETLAHKQSLFLWIHLLKDF